MTDHHIDAFGDFCPIPSLKVQAVMKKMNPGDRIILITDHSCTANTIREDMQLKKFKVIVEEVDNGIWEIIIMESFVNKNR
ncbi:MAG: sulfurtransferase TusA family protein [Sporomusaceae bacterium]|nr:sulfurtransferase TusA family protein [Sporomusaceae bacterium]